MIKFVAFFIFSWMTVAQALSIQQKITPIDGSLTLATVFLCHYDESAFCQKLCNNETECLRPEPVCLNCSGTDSIFMRLIFTKLNQFFTQDEQQTAPQVFEDLTSLNWTAVLPGSIYNFYRASTDPQTAKDFKELCNQDVIADPVLFIEMDAEQKPSRLISVACPTSTGMNFYKIKQKINLKDFEYLTLKDFEEINQKDFVNTDQERILP